MRYLIIITAFLLIPMVFFAQQTYVPDDNFEQFLIDKGYDSGPLNDSVPTSNIDTVIKLIIWAENISDLTGIENFLALEGFRCTYNQISSLDMSNNTKLKELNCSDNNLTSLDLSNNAALEWLWCYNNILSSLDVNKNSVLLGLYCHTNNLIGLNVSNNTALELLTCSENKLTSLDLSNNATLKILSCSKNEIKSLNIKNGNNKNITGDQWDFYFDATDNPDLYCIQVDDSSWSANAEKWKKDDHAHYSEDCGYTSVGEFLSAGTAINIFPNPADKNFTVSFELETPKTLAMTLTDLSGIELQEFSLANKQYVNEEIDVSMLSSGIYFLNIDFGSESISRKIVVE